MPENDNPLVAELEAVRTQALGELQAMSDLTDLDAWRIQYLGRRGALTQVMRGIGQLTPGAAPRGGAGLQRCQKRAGSGI